MTVPLERRASIGILEREREKESKFSKDVLWRQDFQIDFCLERSLLKRFVEGRASKDFQ